MTAVDAQPTDNTKMYIAPHEWSALHDQPAHFTDPAVHQPLADLYQRLAASFFDRKAHGYAKEFLKQQIAQLDNVQDDLPDRPDKLEAWMHQGAQAATAQYVHYLDERKAGSPRRFFSNRAHALYFLRSVAPTKLVDGSWLYGLLPHWRNPRFSDLIRTYIEELGEGDAQKNHVVLYKQLLSRHNLDPIDDLPEELYVQGLIQLALAADAETMLPEVIGFNLGYEQLPLHLLITAYELNELGIDPYYFTLHVTVDNADTGHARRAVQAVLDNIPRLGGADDFWRRVRVGFGLSNAGVGTTQVIQDFDIEQEVIRIFTHKSTAGQGAHSDYCRVGGRNVNDWLSRKEDVPEFLAALEKAGWIKRNVPVAQSRFWNLLQGDHSEMFGVFSSYELQVIHDWIRGGASSDGMAYTDIPAKDGQPRRMSFRVAARLEATRNLSICAHAPPAVENLLDSDLQALTQQLPLLDGDAQAALLIHAMTPDLHWAPAGLHATRLFIEGYFSK